MQLALIIFISFLSTSGRYGIEQLYIPTVDHFEPTAKDLKTAVDFIRVRQVSQRWLGCSNPSVYCYLSIGSD